MYTTITENTNLYAISKDALTKPIEINSRYWFFINEDEIRVLFGIFNYMGVHREPQYTLYWETERIYGPNYIISKYMSLNRYENLRRYLYISPLKPIELLAVP